MKALSLAWRNLLRNRRRSLMTLIAMVLGEMAVLLFGGYVRDINYGLQSDFVRLSGHLQIQHKDYFRFGTGNPSAYGIAGYERILDLVRKDELLAPMLEVATPTLQFGAIAGNFAAGVSRTVYVSGTVVEDQSRMREWNEYQLRFVSRRLLLSETGPDAAVIGTGVARVLQLCATFAIVDCAAAGPSDLARGAPALPDDIAALSAPSPPTGQSSRNNRPLIEILATNSKGAPNVAAVRVHGAEFQGVKELDDVHVGLHLAQAQRLVFGAAQPKITAIALQLKHTAQIPEARKRLEQLLGTMDSGSTLAVIDYELLNPFYRQTLAMFESIFGFVSILIGAIVLFTVTNTMSMAVVERTSEIGTLRAIGLRRGGIRSMFVTEGIVLGFIGALIGIACALLLAGLINELGLTWTPPGRVEPVPLAVQLFGERAMMLASGLGLVVLAGASALLPAARASRMNIVDALRHV